MTNRMSVFTILHGVVSASSLRYPVELCAGDSVVVTAPFARAGLEGAAIRFTYRAREELIINDAAQLAILLLETI